MSMDSQLNGLSKDIVTWIDCLNTKISKLLLIKVCHTLSSYVKTKVAGNNQGKSVNFNLLVKEVEKTNNPTSETFVLPNLGAFRLLCNPPFHTPPSICLFPLWFMLSCNFD